MYLHHPIDTDESIYNVYTFIEQNKEIIDNLFDQAPRICIGSSRDDDVVLSRSILVTCAVFSYQENMPDKGPLLFQEGIEEDSRFHELVEGMEEYHFIYQMEKKGLIEFNGKDSYKSTNYGHRFAKRYQENKM